MVWINSWWYVIFIDFLLFLLDKVWLFTNVLSCWNKSITDCHLDRLLKHAGFFLLHLKCKGTYSTIIYLLVWMILFFFLNFYLIKLLGLLETEWRTKCFRVSIGLNWWWLKAFKKISLDISSFCTNR